MNKWIVLPASLAALIGAALLVQAQVPAGQPAVVTTAGVYQSGTQTCSSGQACYLQVDVNGNLKTTSTGGGGGGPATIADGADIAEGSTTDAASTAGGVGTVSAKLRLITTQLAAATPAGTNVIGKVSIDQTTPGTTNLVALAANQSVNNAQVAGTTIDTNSGSKSAGTQRVVIATDQLAVPLAGQGATGAAVPANAVLAGAQSGANLVGIIQASASVPISMSSATTTQFVALSGSTKIYITSWDVVSAGTTNVTLVYGTGSNCGTGTTTLAGLYTLTAQAGISKGSGLGPVLVVPAGNALCVTNSQAIVIGGSVSYTQF